MESNPADARSEPDAATATVTIVGAGMAGAACAAALAAAGRSVRILDRGRAPGGRMASPELHGRRVDIGAGYFTVRDEGFDSLVLGWESAGLATRWTDTFAVLQLGEPPRHTTGPQRWGTPHGLRSLVRTLLGDPLLGEIEVTGGAEVDAAALSRLPGPVVLAMPDPQAARLLEVPEPVAYDPVITVVCGFAERRWAFADAAFVHDHPDVEFIADDGRRRGDGAPVLVAHSTSRLAAECLTDPQQAVAPVLAALSDLAATGAPEWTHAHRWTFAKPAGAHQQTFGHRLVDGRQVYFAGDQWCPQGSPRVESAWRSGTDVAAAILQVG